jgi:hypothetical protein
MDFESLQNGQHTTHHRDSVRIDGAQKKEMTASERMQHNANREAMIKNWKIDFSYDPNTYSSKYVHVSGQRAVYIKLVGRFVEENKPGTTSLELTKLLLEKFKADKDTLKIYSPEMASFDVRINQEKPLAPENMIRVFVRKDDVNDAATLIHVIGSVSGDDLDYIVEDFFLRIQSVMAGGGNAEKGRNEQKSGGASEEKGSGDTPSDQK